MILPVRSQPLNVLFDGIHELHPLLGRVRVVKTHVELSVILLCQTVIQKNGFSMTDVQITVRLWREPGTHMIIHSLS